MKRRNLMTALLNTFACLAWAVSLIITPRDAGFPYVSMIITAVFAAGATFFWVAYMRERNASDVTSSKLNEGEL